MYKRLQPATREKPPNFPPEIPGKSPTFSENFRKFPEIPENPGSRPRKIVHFWGVYKRLQPETGKKPPNFPPKFRGNPGEIPELPEIPEIPGGSVKSQKYLPCGTCVVSVYLGIRFP